MQAAFEQIARFVEHGGCVFTFGPLDYPSPLHQRILTAFCELKELLTMSASDILRVFHSSNDRQLQSTVYGMIYHMILSNPSDQFLKYVNTLRTEAWVLAGKCLSQIICDIFATIKKQFRPNIVNVVDRLYYFGHLTQELLLLLVKSIDCFDHSRLTIAYSHTLVQFFLKICQQEESKKNSATMSALCHTLFYKLTRIIALLPPRDEQSYKAACIKLLSRLFAFNPGLCYSNPILLKHIQYIQKEDKQQPLISAILTDLLAISASPALISTHKLLFYILPLSKTLSYILGEKITKPQISLQLKWLYASLPDEAISSDILQFMLVQQNFIHDNTLEQIVHILEWLFKKAIPNHALYSQLKHALYDDWFHSRDAFLQIDISLRFTSYMLEWNPQLGEDLLIFLFRHKDEPIYKRRLREVFTKAVAILDPTRFYSQLHYGTRQSYQDIMAVQAPQQAIQTVEQASLDQLQFSSSEEEQQLGRSMSNHYLDEIPDVVTTASAVESFHSNEPLPAQPLSFGVQFQKHFYEDLSEIIQTLMTSPSVLTYSQFFNQLLTCLKTFKKEGEPQLLEMFIHESSKLTYLVFYNEFEDHRSVLSQEESIIYMLLQTVNSSWAVNSLPHQHQKKIIKKIITNFDTTEIAFWKYFLTYFKRGTTANIKDMKDWLIPKEKAKIVLPILRQAVTEQAYKIIADNASLLKLTI